MTLTKSLIALLVIALLLPTVPAASRAQTPAAGQIAIVGADGNLYRYDMASASSVPLTTDAIAGAKQYAWPTWATDGTLAYFGTNFVAPPYYRLGIFVQPTEGSAQQVYASRDEIFTYAYWSPGECLGGGCRDLAVLYTARDGGLAVRRVRTLEQAPAEVTELSTGGPFYWDWAPDGQRLFWTRFNAELALYDLGSDSVVRTFSEMPGFQRAVDWSPVDDRLLTTVLSPQGDSSLVIFDGEARIVLAEDLPGVTTFEWSPDGAQVAYLDADRGTLRLVDARTGAPVAQIAESVVGFFWSPDGSKIAYITLTREGNDLVARQQGAAPVIRWHVYQVATGISQRLARFLPSRDMLYYLEFFDQFAHSHRLWSPDSRYLVYGEWQREGAEQVMLLDTTAPGLSPQPLMDGSIGIFSWR